MPKFFNCTEHPASMLNSPGMLRILWRDMVGGVDKAVSAITIMLDWNTSEVAELKKQLQAVERRLDLLERQLKKD